MAEGLLEALSPLRIFKAKEFPKDFVWLNTKEPLTVEKLKGNIVVLEFWTYGCINCMHMALELAQIEEKYKDRPVIVIGVHTAKYTNEQEKTNVESAVERYGVKHPIVIDQKMRIWKDYGSQGWPTLVIIDPTGEIAYRQSGEGQVNSLEGTIDRLLEKHSKNKTLKKRIKIGIPRPKRHSSTLSFPGKIAFSPDGKRMAISDSGNNRILIVETKSGVISKIIGGGHGFADGDFHRTKLSKPQGILWLDTNTIYIADTENHSIRQADLKTGMVSTVAGNGKQTNWLALGGDALKISLSSPWDLAYSNGNIYVAMAGTHQVWRYGVKSGKILPYLGSGFEGIGDGNGMGALLAQPSGLSIHGGYLYFVDSEASAVRRAELSTGLVHTIAGKGLFSFGYKDGALKGSQFQHPQGICALPKKIYVADTYNQAIREIDLASEEVRTVVGGQKNPGFCRFDDPHCDVLGLYEPNDVKLHEDKLYIADTNNHLIRIFDLKTNLLSTLEIKSKKIR